MKVALSHVLISRVSSPDSRHWYEYEWRCSASFLPLSRVPRWSILGFPWPYRPLLPTTSYNNHFVSLGIHAWRSHGLEVNADEWAFSGIDDQLYLDILGFDNQSCGKWILKPDFGPSHYPCVLNIELLSRVCVHCILVILDVFQILRV